MSKPWSDRPLWEKLYGEGDVHRTVAKLIGYDGKTPSEFCDQAKLLPNYDKWKFETAVRDLTDFNKREAPVPRYELSAHARKCVRVLLGPAPEDPEFKRWHELRAISLKKMGQTVPEAKRPPVPPKKPAKRETRKPPAKRPK